jgi:hypothetical protein
MRSKLRCGQQQNNTERRRQSDAPSNNEKGSRDQNRKTAESAQVGHPHYARTRAGRGGRRKKWDAPVSPESLAEWLQSDKALEIQADPEMPC